MKKQQWKKLGLIFQPDNNLDWQKSHAALPTKLKISESQYRFYFASRNTEGRSAIGFFDVDFSNEPKVVYISKQPVLKPGEWGYFDDHGVQPCSIAKSQNGDLYLYYLGWNPGLKQPLFYTSVGLAISKDGGDTFEKYSKSPILQRSEFDPWMVSGGTVLQRNVNDWVLFYLSGFRFVFSNNKATSYYDIKKAYSNDGINWERKGEVAIHLKDDETNISRLSIIENNVKSNLPRYESWFPVKKEYNEGYQCGYAVSDNGVNWTRINDDVLEYGPDEWDSYSIDKMEIVSVKDNQYMFYNGNKFGLNGIGVAIRYE